MTLLRVVGAAVLFLLTVRSTAFARTPDIKDPLCGTPLIRSVGPATGRAGTLHVAMGDCLGADSVRKVFLTDGKQDIPLEIIVQSDITVHFRIPNGTKAGRYHLMILTGGSPPKLIEQPVRLEVVEESTAR